MESRERMKGGREATHSFGGPKQALGQGDVTLPKK